jgi:hypothetical protein
MTLSIELNLPFVRTNLWHSSGLFAAEVGTKQPIPPYRSATDLSGDQMRIPVREGVAATRA